MMWKTARVAALALTILGSMSFARDGFAAAYADGQGVSTQGGSTQGVVVTEDTIARLKGVLRLSAAQQIHWRTLEATLRGVAHKSQQETGTGFMQRVRARVKAYVLDISAARRVAAAAQPLIASLDEGQKRDGMNAVRALGVASLF